jgi:hypothetical protein
MPVSVGYAQQFALLSHTRSQPSHGRPNAPICRRPIRETRQSRNLSRPPGKHRSRPDSEIVLNIGRRIALRNATRRRTGWVTALDGDPVSLRDRCHPPAALGERSLASLAMTVHRAEDMAVVDRAEAGMPSGNPAQPGHDLAAPATDEIPAVRLGEDLYRSTDRILHRIERAETCIGHQRAKVAIARIAERRSVYRPAARARCACRDQRPQATFRRPTLLTSGSTTNFATDSMA